MSSSIKKNTILNTIKTLCSIIFPLITFPYISRVLLPECVGRVNWAKSYVSYFALIASLGITTYAIRTCSIYKDDKSKLSKVASEIFSINVITTIISYVLLALTLIFFRKLDVYRTLIIVDCTTILFTTLGADYLNSAMEDFKYITIRTIAFQILSLIAMFVFIHNQDDYIKYMLITVIASSGANISNYFYRQRYCKIRFTLDIPWKQHIIPILLMFAMSLSQIIFSNADITMLGLIKDDFEVGIYSTAHKVTIIIAQVVQSVILVILPRLSKFFENNDYDHINPLLKKVLSFNIGLGLPCVMGVEMLADDITYLVGGEQFMSAAPVMRILVLSFMFSLVGGSFLGNAILIPSKKEKYYMLVCWITAFCNVILNYILIPRLGSVGAAISTAFNGLLIFILLLFNVDKKIKIDKWYEVFIGPLLGCVAIAGSCFVCYFIDNLMIRVIASLVSSACLYAGILLLTKNQFSIEIINTFISKMKKNK